jgi:hypothetical protein
MQRHRKSRFASRVLLATLVAQAAACKVVSTDNYYPELYGIACDGDRCVAAGDDGIIVTSEDGVAWTLRPAGVTSNLASVAVGGGRFVVAGRKGELLWSSDRQTFTRVSGWQASLEHAIFCRGQFWVVGQDGTVASSPDGTDWSTRHSGTPWAWRIACGDNALVVVERGAGGVLSSADGSDWSRVDLGGSAHCGLAFGATVFVAVTPDGTIRISADGAAWSVAKQGAWSGDSLCDVAFGAGAFVIVEMGGTILVSTDGTTWQKLDYDADGLIAPLGVTYTGSGFRVVGTGGTLAFQCSGATCTSPKYGKITVPRPGWIGGPDAGSGGDECGGCATGEVCVSGRTCINGMSCECAGSMGPTCVNYSAHGYDVKRCGECSAAYTACCPGTVCVNGSCLPAASLPSGCTTQ